jgi:hypothetical protein
MIQQVDDLKILINVKRRINSSKELFGLIRRESDGCSNQIKGIK